MIQPKPFLDKLYLRNKKEGKIRNKEMSLKILEKGTPLPLPVGYKDIDAAMQKWVEDELEISYENTKLPTLKLFANQRINEYAQTWKHLDENGNILLNFKTITRENNPQKGENQGTYANIPGDRDYPMFLVPVLQDNQQVAYDMFSMKQPFCVNLTYIISIITNKYELINAMNQLIHNKFKAITQYIFPNNHPMPLTLENINDESEYSLDDRKYYSQSFHLKLKAYIIQEQDFKITKLPSRLIINTIGDKIKRKDILCQTDGVWEEYDETCENGRYYYKKIQLIINFDTCTNQKTIIDNDFVIRNVETFNIYDFILFVNNEKQNLENDVKIYKEDEICIKISKTDILSSSKIIITGFDPNVIYDSEYDPELSIDEQKDEIKEY